MGFVESFKESADRVKRRRKEAPAALDALMERSSKMHPTNLGLQALVYIEAPNMFHPSQRTIQTIIKETRRRIITIEEARVEITEAIRAFRATIPEVRHD